MPSLGRNVERGRPTGCRLCRGAGRRDSRPPRPAGCRPQRPSDHQPLRLGCAGAASSSASAATERPRARRPEPHPDPRGRSPARGRRLGNAGIGLQRFRRGGRRHASLAWSAGASAGAGFSPILPAALASRRLGGGRARPRRARPRLLRRFGLAGFCFGLRRQFGWRRFSRGGFSRRRFGRSLFALPPAPRPSSCGCAHLSTAIGSASFRRGVRFGRALGRARRSSAAVSAVASPEVSSADPLGASLGRDLVCRPLAGRPRRGLVPGLPMASAAAPACRRASSSAAAGAASCRSRCRSSHGPQRHGPQRHRPPARIFVRGLNLFLDAFLLELAHQRGIARNHHRRLGHRPRRGLEFLDREIGADHRRIALDPDRHAIARLDQRQMLALVVDQEVHDARPAPSAAPRACACACLPLPARAAPATPCCRRNGSARCHGNAGRAASSIPACPAAAAGATSP